MKETPKRVITFTSSFKGQCHEIFLHLGYLVHGAKVGYNAHKQYNSGVDKAWTESYKKKILKMATNVVCRLG